MEIAWTQTYAAQGAAYLDRVRDLAAQDPSCHAGSCSTSSWSHWYRGDDGAVTVWRMGWGPFQLSRPSP